MKNYETLLLLRTETTGDEIKFLEDSMEKRISKVNGEVVTFDKWGKVRLAYPVRKQEYGVYMLARYTLPPESAIDFEKGLQSFFKIKCSDFVMRYVTVRVQGKLDPDYKRPEAVDVSNHSRLRGRNGTMPSARPPGARGSSHGLRVGTEVDLESSNSFESRLNRDLSSHDEEGSEIDREGHGSGEENQA